MFSRSLFVLLYVFFWPLYFLFLLNIPLWCHQILLLQCLYTLWNINIRCSRLSRGRQHTILIKNIHEIRLKLKLALIHNKMVTSNGLQYNNIFQQDLLWQTCKALNQRPMELMILIFSLKFPTRDTRTVILVLPCKSYQRTF
jgi:hypothetical protein